MVGMLVGVLIAQILTFFVGGFNVWTIMSCISSLCFSIRAVGIICSKQVIYGTELGGAGVYLGLKLLGKNVNLKVWVMVGLIRVVYLLIVRHDLNHYVYVREEHRRDLK